MDLDPVYVSLSEGPIVDQLRELRRDVRVLRTDTASTTLNRRAGWRTTATSARNLARLGNQLEGMQIGLLMPSSIKSGVVAIAARRHLRVPLVWWIHDRLTTEYMGNLKAPLVRALVRTFSSGLVVNSRNTYEALGAPHLPTLQLPPGVEAIAHVGVTERHRPMERGLRLAMVGRISPWKGQLTLIEALALLPPGTVAECHLYGAPLFGEEDYLLEIQRAIQTSGLSDVVKIHGHVDDAAGRLSAVDVVVHASSIPEPFGAVVVEGLGAGCVVVAANAGGPAEVITDGLDGLLYPAGSARDLASALVQVRRMPGSARGAMARRGIDTAGMYAYNRLGPVLEEWLRAWLNGASPQGYVNGVKVGS